MAKYYICCCNEWCSGPEKYLVVDNKPDKPTPCPTCGWLAIPQDRASMRKINNPGSMIPLYWPLA